MSLAPGLCLVTGATGFVGSAVARALLLKGHQVRVLARPGGDRRNLGGLSVEISEGAMEDAAIPRPRGRRLPVSVPRRRRLSAVGSRPGGDVPRQCRRHPRPDDRSARRRCRAHRPYQQRRHDRSGSRRLGRRGDAEPARRHDRALQAVKIPGRGGRSPADRRARPARGDRQSVDAGRPARPQADADRAADPRSRTRPSARLCRHRAQYRACRRRRRRSSRSGRDRADR